jgi:hypothetical protein
LAFHYEGAGDRQRAGEYCRLAAMQAAAALAFDRAATLYRRAIELYPGGKEQEHLLRVALAEALASGGRGAEAAKEYLAAVTGADASEALELHRLAAEQYLISGHIDDGLAILDEVLLAVGVRPPSSPLMTFLSILKYKALLKLRRFHFRQRRVAEISATDLRRIDVCWSATSGLLVVDPFRALLHCHQMTYLALKAGEPLRVMRGLAIEAAAFSATLGPRNDKRTLRLLDMAESIAGQLKTPYAAGFTTLARGMVNYVIGRWRIGREYCERAEVILADECKATGWELDTARTFTLWSLLLLGELAVLSRRRAELITDAQRRGDLYLSTNLGTYIGTLAHLAADDASRAEKELRHAMSQWSQRGFHVQHHNLFLSRGHIELYRGDGEAAWSYAQEVWPHYQSSMMLRIVQQVRIDVLQLRARCALGASVAVTDPRLLLREADRLARRLDREGTPWSQAMATLIRACIALRRGIHDQAATLFRNAIIRLETIDMRMHAAAARRRLGEVLGGEEGATLIAEADSWMVGQKIVNPVRMTAMLTPGLPH